MEPLLSLSPLLMAPQLVYDYKNLCLKILILLSLSPAGSDYTAITMSVTFEAGSTRATVNVQITDDNVVESEEDFTAVLSSSESIGGNTATVSVLDNDGSLHFLKGTFSKKISF